MSNVKASLKLLIFAVLLSLPVFIYGQNPHELIIEPGPGVFINEVVAGDTLPNGQRADLERIYVLRRNNPYFVNVAIRNSGFDIRMKAEDGAGFRPVIFMVENAATQTFPGEIYRITGGNLWIKDLILVGFLESDPNEINNIPAGLVRVDASGYDIVIDRCLMTQTRGQHIRTEGACRLIKATNTVWANMGDLGLSNLGAGKAIDLRGTSCDSLVFINNTFINFQDRIVRHRTSTGAIKHFIFDHNTLINGLSFHGTIVMGWVGTEVQITNNLFFDTFVCGNDTDATRQAEFEEHGELDPFGFPAMRWNFSVPNDTTSWTVSNNYYTVSPEVEAFYAAHAAAGVTGEGQPLTDHILSKSGVEPFIEESGLTLNNRPAVMINMAEWYRNPVWGANKTKSTTNFVRTRDDFDRRGWLYFNDTLDAKYPTSSAAYTGSTSGGPVGDLNWWGLVGIGDIPNDPIIADFQVKQNYPNPFNPSTKIEFVLSKAGDVRVEIYNLVGQKIATLMDEKLTAGEHSIVWDAKNVASGVYFYKVQLNNVSKTRKMVLMK